MKLESVDLLEIRRNNIQRLVEQYGSFGELNHKMGRSRRDTDIEDVFFAKRDDGSRYTRSRQTMLSHRIERSLGLPSGWMDMGNPPIVQEIKNEPEQRKPHVPVQKSDLALELEKVVVKNGTLEQKAADRAQERLKTVPSVQTATERTEPQATVRARLLIMRRKKTRQQCFVRRFVWTEQIRSLRFSQKRTRHCEGDSHSVGTEAARCASLN